MSQLKLHFASLSLGASVDQQTGNLSVFEILEEIRVPQLPIHLQSLVISLVLEKLVPEARSGKLFIHILTPDGKQALLGNGDMQIPADQRRMKAVFRLGGFPILQFGSHRFVVSWVNSSGSKDGEVVLDFEVLQAPGQEQGSSNAPAGSGEKPPLTH